MSASRVSLGQAAPELYQAVAGLDGLAGKLATTAGIGEGLSQLLKLRASQINGCAFCIKMHTQAALAAGESADKVAVVPAWRETNYFSEKEAAALSLIEAVTLTQVSQMRILKGLKSSFFDAFRDRCFCKSFHTNGRYF